MRGLLRDGRVTSLLKDQRHKSGDRTLLAEPPAGEKAGMNEDERQAIFDAAALASAIVSFLTTMTQPGSGSLTSMTQGGEGVLTTLTHLRWAGS